ncbi:MAG: DEAD/DEAH box helicase [Bdellovibrionaceae bacterium]|nr:DEAD/DEAH box helicase [Pseudobdellovibrionaceae bacterium]
MNFADLGLDSQLLQAIEKLGYASTTPIQEKTIPVLLEGRDVSGLAQTGTGKTAAFLIPLMDRILKGRVSTEGMSEDDKKNLDARRFVDWRAQNFILVLVPTRELAEQVYENAVKLSMVSGLRAVSVYGGTSYEKQKEGLAAGVEFVVATPGRLIDLYKEHVCDLKQVRAVVFDEADRMFDMGFKDDMKFILQRIPKERQVAVFSATMNFDVTNTLYQFGSDPVEVDVSRDQPKAENVKDSIYHCGQDEKAKYLLSIFKKHNPKQAIIFSNFKNNVERISKFLSDNGVPAMGISSLLTQAQRNRVLEQFKAENDKNVLVATDVAARGLDIKGVDLVVNFELPQDAESYVHRIGRTGRAGATGTAFSLVSDRDIESLERVQEYLKHKLDVEWMEDTEFVADFKPLPSERGGYDRAGGGEGRGPRRDGPRRDGAGGGRPGGRDGGRGGRDGGRGRGPRGDGPRADGPRREGRPGDRPRGPQKPREDGAPTLGAEAGAPQGGRRGGRDGGRGRDQNRGPRPQNANGAANGQRPKQASGKPHSRPTPAGQRPKSAPGKAPAGVLGKVKSWFRRLVN